MNKTKVIITAFGQQFRTIRKEHKVTLEDAASFLGVSESYLTAVERGEKTLPYVWINKIITHYELSKVESDKLWNSFDKTPKTDKIPINQVVQAMRNFYMNITGKDYVPKEHEEKIQRFINGAEMFKEDKKS